MKGVSTQLHTAKERAEQLKKCCETIIENAEKIMDDIDLTTNRKIIIEMQAKQPPTITVEQEFLSSKSLDIYR